MVSRLLQGNPAALYDSRLRRLLAKFAAHPQRMHGSEIGIESLVSRARGKFNGANSTHYILCTDETRGVLCLLSSDADGETEPFASPEHFALYRLLPVLNLTPNVLDKNNFERGRISALRQMLPFTNRSLNSQAAPATTA
jgi:hypothetical protein